MAPIVALTFFDSNYAHKTFSSIDKIAIIYIIGFFKLMNNFGKLMQLLIKS